MLGFVSMIAFWSNSIGVIRPVDTPAVVQEWLMDEYGFQVGPITAHDILHPETKGMNHFVDEFEGERIRMRMELDETGKEYRIVDRSGRVIPPLAQR